MTYPRLGVHPHGDGTATVRVWAPHAHRVTLVVEGGAGAPAASQALEAAGDGLHAATVGGLPPGTRYRLRLDDGPPLPDPAARFQPDGVHGPSEVIDPAAYAWHDDAWTGRALADLVVCELHVGTFTPAGTFAAAQAKLPALADLGVTAVELMPVADFPGARGWGYDPAAFYAPCRAYGRPDDLRAFVDAAHGLGLAVLLDVIPNHLGPDGAYVAAFGPVLTERDPTPWGPAVNLDGPGAAGVRAFLLDCFRHWLEAYHLDGLRLDATLSLRDASTPHFLEELAAFVATLEGPPRLLIAEDLRNLAHPALPRDQGGFGLDAVWSDDLHHQVQRLLLADADPPSGDAPGPFAAYAHTTAADLATTVTVGWTHPRRQLADDDPYAGRYVGTAADLAPEQVVAFLQNHDRVGNRPDGARLHHVAPLPLVRAATALLLLAPQTPLLFMGQAWAASTPFTFFTDHAPALGAQVRAGRRAEVAARYGPDVPLADPQAEATFAQCVLDWSERTRAPHAGMLRLHRDLLALRRTLPADAPAHAEAHGDRALALHRGAVTALVALAPGAVLPVPPGATLRLATETPRYAGSAATPAVRDGAALRFPSGGAAVFWR